MVKRCQSGLAILPLVVLLLAVAFAGAFATRQAQSDAGRQLARSCLGPEVEQLAIQALEEAHYRLVMSHRPAPSSSAARAAVRAAFTRGRELGPELSPVPAVPSGPLDHDAAQFLLSSSQVLHFAPTLVASTIGDDSGIELSGVEARVVDRSTGSWARTGASLTASRLDEMGLPFHLDAIRTTWGVLQLSCEGRGNLGHSVMVTRKVILRRLFTVVEYSFPSDDGPMPGVFAHIFPAPIGRVVER